MRLTWMTVAVLTTLAACSPAEEQKTGPTPAKPVSATPTPTNSPLAVTNNATFIPPVDDKIASPTLIRAQILLDRAKFSPGVIDGFNGDNFRHALAAYQETHNLPGDGTLDEATFKALTTADGGPVLKEYTITPEDVAGPFTPAVGEDLVAMSKLSTVGYATPREALSERFHMDESLLASLNPSADFAKAGAVILVADPAPDGIAGEVKRIEIAKADNSLRAYDASGKLLALFPATVGSTDKPSPTGSYKIKGVAKAPEYIYDPAKLSWGPKSKGKLTIPAGPNNPVGAVWIDLDRPSYGIHGTPDPDKVGKTASHGCVRLTNWDARELAAAVKFGVPVIFVDKATTGA